MKGTFITEFHVTCTVAYQYVRLVQVVYSARGSRLNVWRKALHGWCGCRPLWVHLWPAHTTCYWWRRVSSPPCGDERIISPPCQGKCRQALMFPCCSSPFYHALQREAMTRVGRQWQMYRWRSTHRHSTCNGSAARAQPQGNARGVLSWPPRLLLAAC